MRLLNRDQVINSVGYDTVKLYHDTDADTFTGKKYYDTDTFYTYHDN